MAIIQISKLQQRSGNLVDLPQLDDAEFGWASDSKRLFIGKSTPNENIEVLTSYSNISFNQINGAIGNLNITAASAGQVLSYDGTNWINYTGTGLAGSGNLQLGNVSNVRIAGGAIGYVLQTDGQGNLSWTPKTTVTATIKGLSAATPVVMTVDTNTPYTNATQVTISGATGAGNTIVNGLSFYVKVATNFPTTGNVSLYTDATLLTALVGTGIVYTANSGIAVSTISGSGTSAAGGASTSIQYNNGGIITGSANLTFDFTTNLLTVSGNANVGNVNTPGVVTSSRVISNIATGTAPLTITSSTLVPNLYVARANVADFEVVTSQTTGTFYPTFVNGSSTANYAQASNANLSFNVATGTLSSTLLTGTLTTAAQPNITSTGTLSSLAVTGNISSGNANLGNLLIANFHQGTLTTAAQPNITSTGTLTALAVTGNITSGNANLGNLLIANFLQGTLTTAAQPNITSTGTLTALAVTGNISGANITGTHYGAATGLTAIPGANVTGTVPSATVAASANAVAGANVSGTVALATSAGTVTTAAQPNITSVGTLSRVLVGNGTAGAPSIGFASDGAQDTGFFWGGDGYTSITNNGVYSGQFQPGGALIMVGPIQTPTLTTGANTTAGTITGNWGLSAGSKLTATYADLAEYYTADRFYSPGTVLSFGGDQEVTLAEDATNKVAGVVSTNPAYVMNSLCKGEFVVALALQGRVPCKVRGTIAKGDMLVSGGDGYARPATTPLMGTVIGKALENFSGSDGIIEVAVGRL